MGDPVIIEFLSSLRNSFQIIAIKNKIRTTTENPMELKLQFLSKYFCNNTKTSV